MSDPSTLETAASPAPARASAAHRRRAPAAEPRRRRPSAGEPAAAIAATEARRSPTGTRTPRASRWGCVLLAAFVFTGRGLGASGAMTRLAAHAVQKTEAMVKGGNGGRARHLRAHNAYTAQYINDESDSLDDFLVYMFVGVIVGGFISRRAGAAREAVRTFDGPAHHDPAAIAAWPSLGGFVSAFGARLARGLHLGPGADRRRDPRAGQLGRSCSRSSRAATRSPTSSGRSGSVMEPIAPFAKIAEWGSRARYRRGRAAGHRLRLRAGARRLRQREDAGRPVVRLQLRGAAGDVHRHRRRDAGAGRPRRARLRRPLARATERDVPLAPQLVGGLIFGFGFVIGQYCPGTAVVACATGSSTHWSSWAASSSASSPSSSPSRLFADFYGSTRTWAASLSAEGLGIPVGSSSSRVVLMALGAFAVTHVLDRRFAKQKRFSNLA